MADIKTVATIAGVSPSTVSNVFSKKKFVSEEAKQRVLRVCKELNYMPSVMASSIITKSTNIIGFFDVQGQGYSDVYSDMIKGITRKAAELGKGVLLNIGLKDPDELNSVLRAGCQPVDGAILPLPLERDLRIENLSFKAVPHVLIGSPYRKYEKTSSVDVDNTLLSYKLTNHLINLGHKRIAMINYKSGYTVTDDRQKGYELALKEAGIHVSKELVFHTGIKEQDGFDCIEALFAKRIEFSAAIVSMPEAAEGVYKAIEKNEKKVGEDISVAAFSSDKGMHNPLLTAVDTDYVRVGTEAMEILQELIENKSEKPIRRILESEIIFTQSCQRYKGRL